jgi:3-deoxy-7-phosphoheptulonate synthase
LPQEIKHSIFCQKSKRSIPEAKIWQTQWVIVVMHKNAREREIESVEKRLHRDLPHLHLKRIDGEELTVIAAVGDADALRELDVESMPGVDRLVPIDQPYKLASLETRRRERTSFSVGSASFGDDHLSLILGPCTVESRESAVKTALLCKKAGADLLRAGVFKPRTSPFSFQGPGYAGLGVLQEMREETGLAIVSEMTSSEQGEALSEVVDMIQIGARNMQNYALLQTAGKLGKPILLKRGLSATLDEFLQSADYILSAGEERVVLCERGIRTFDSAARFTLDLGAVPLLQEKTHLPVIVDPSHAAGKRNLVAPFARGAVAVGADGLIVETTVKPQEARCDANQQLDAENIAAFVKEMRSLHQAVKN